MLLLDVPSSLAGLLSLFGACFTQPTFQTFCGLTVGILTRVRERTVTGMLSAAGLAGFWHHSRAHRFFSRARWSVDRVGLVALDLILARLLDAAEPVCVAIDDTLLKRFGPKVYARCQGYDGASTAPGRVTAFGNMWVIAGVVVKLAFLERPVCLPVLFRLWRPRQGPTQVELACELAGLLGRHYPQREVIVLADAAYAGRTMSPGQLPANVTLVLRARRDIRLYDPPPRHPNPRGGRPRLRGDQLPALRTIAADPNTRWRRVSARMYCREQTVELITQQGLWYRGWRTVPVKLLCIRNRDRADQIETVLISSNPKLPNARILELYALRWSIEVAIRDGKQLAGVGEAQNRTRLAVERSAPFAFLCLTLAIIWYALYGHQPGDTEQRRARQPWYRTKHQPSVQDMLAKFRRTIIANRVSLAIGQSENAKNIEQLTEAWELAAA